MKKTDEANNTGLQTKRVGRGEKVRFTYNMPTATDQEIIVYAGHYLKSLGDVSNLQPTSMLIANADRLTEIECHSPNLINTDLSECTKLQRIDLSDCTALGTGIGAQPILNIQNCKYLRYCNCMNTQLTAIYTMQAGGNLEEIYYPQSTQVVQLTNQTYLHTIGLPSTNPCENLADVQITNCNAVKTLSSETTVLDFNTLKYVQNLNITNSLSGLNSMHFNGFDKLRNVTLSSLKELNTIGFEDMMPVTTTSTLKNITISDCPLITSLSFNVSSDDYKVAFASNGKLDLGGLQSLKSIECNTSVKGLDTLIVPTSLTDLRFTTEYGDGINEIKNIWSASAVHNNDGFEGIDFQDMTIEFIDMLGLNGISNAINFHIAPKTQNPNLNTARDGSVSKPWFHPIGSIDLSNYTGLMIGMLRGIDLNKLDVVINTDRDQVDLTSLFECATLPTAQNIVTKTNNILAKFPKSVIWDYMFKGCDLSFSPKDIRIPNRGLSLKGMYKDSNVTEDVSLPNVIMAVDEMFMNCTGITTYEKNWLKTYSKITYTVPTSNGTSGSWDDSGNYTEGTNYNQFLYTPSTVEKAFKIMTTGTGVVRINYFYNASFLSRIVYTPEFDSYPYVVTIPDGCNKVIFVCDKTIRFASEGTITTSNCYTNTGGALSEIPTSWGGYGLDKNVTSIYVIDTTLLTNTTTFNLVLNDNQAGITDWGDGVTNSEKSHTYAEHGVYTIKTKSWSNGTPSDDLKTALIEVKQIKLIGHNGNSKDYSNSFNGCGNLRKVTAYDLAPSNCSNLFRGCSSLTKIVGMETWNMNNCTDTNYMFADVGITDFSFLDSMDFSKVTYVAYMFQNTKITSLPIDLKPNFKAIDGIFQNCTQLTDVSRWNTELDVSHYNFNRVFNNAQSITEVIFNNWTGKFNSDSYTISGLIGLVTFDIRNCNEGGIDLFWDCPSTLTNVYPPKTLKYNMASFSQCNKLTVDSLVRIINALYDFSADGGTHTIAIGTTNIAKLTREQMLIAIKKHWTIQGAPIQGVFRDTDISKLTSDNTVTAVAIELTADNYTTRIDEVLGVYTNAVDVYFFDDGSVTTLDNMCYENNTATKDRIQNVTFIEGYFENCTRITSAFASCTGLVTVTNIPKSVQYITGMCRNCISLNQVFDFSEHNLNNDLSDAFRNCSSLTTSPIFPAIPNATMFCTFNGCTSLTTVSNLPEGLQSLYSAFAKCTSLETLPTIPSSCTTLRDAFDGCTKLQKVTAYNLKLTDCEKTFINCTTLTEVEGIETWDMSNCTSCYCMFQNCSSLTDLSSITGWDTGKVISTANLCNGCTLLTSIDFIKSWDLSSAISCDYMFSGCKSIEGEVTLQLNMPKCIYISGMFTNCTSITSLNVNGWNIPLSQNISKFVSGCTNLVYLIGTETWNMGSNLKIMTNFIYDTKITELNLSNWDFSNVTNNDFGIPSTLKTVILNNVVDNRAERTSNNGLRGLLNIGSMKTIVMNEFAMTDFSNLFQGVTKIKNDIVFPSNATNVSNCFNGCTGITHIHSNWKTTYNEIVAEDGTTSQIVTTDCYAGCTRVTHCDGVDLGINEYTTGLDEVPISWGGYEFTKDVTSIFICDISLLTDNTLSIIDYDERVGLTNWGDGTVNSEKQHTYTNTGVYTIKTKCIIGNFQGSSSFKTSLTEVKQIATNITRLHNAFWSCSNLTKVTAYDLAPTKCDGMFYNCSSLAEIVGLDTWDMSNCTDATHMFAYCYKMSDFSSIENWDMSNCLSFNYMLENCAMVSIDLTKWVTTACRDLTHLVFNCNKLTSIDLSTWDASNVNTATGCFENCTSLQTVKVPMNLGKSSSFAYSGFQFIYSNCSALTDIIGMETWDMSKSTSLQYTLNNCPKLVNITTAPQNIPVSLNISGSSKLTVDSLMSIINNLITVDTTQTLTLGSTNLTKLTDEQIAIATNKGWTIQ